MSKKYFITGIILTALLVAGIFIYRKIYAADFSVLTRRETAGVKQRGGASAPIEIVEFSDFQCPACMRGAELLHDLQEMHPGAIKVIFKHYPWPMHQWAQAAHESAECANRQNAFWEYHDQLYKAQEEWMRVANVAPLLMQYARNAGLDLDAFAACLTEGAGRQQVTEEKTQGEALNIQSTPTFFVNGVRIVGSVELLQEVDKQLGDDSKIPKQALKASSPA